MAEVSYTVLFTDKGITKEKKFKQLMAYSTTFYDLARKHRKFILVEENVEVDGRIMKISDFVPPNAKRIIIRSHKANPKLPLGIKDQELADRYNISSEERSFRRRIESHRKWIHEQMVVENYVKSIESLTNPEDINDLPDETIVIGLKNMVKGDLTKILAAIEAIKNINRQIVVLDEFKKYDDIPIDKLNLGALLFGCSIYPEDMSELVNTCGYEHLCGQCERDRDYSFLKFNKFLHMATTPYEEPAGYYGCDGCDG